MAAVAVLMLLGACGGGGTAEPGTAATVPSTSTSSTVADQTTTTAGATANTTSTTVAVGDAPASPTAPTTIEAPRLTATILGDEQLVIGQEFNWQVVSENAVRGSWSSDCGVGNSDWAPGDGWGGSYGGAPRTCTLTLTVFDNAGERFTTNHVFELTAG